MWSSNEDAADNRCCCFIVIMTLFLDTFDLQCYNVFSFFQRRRHSNGQLDLPEMELKRQKLLSFVQFKQNNFKWSGFRSKGEGGESGELDKNSIFFF